MKKIFVTLLVIFNTLCGVFAQETIFQAKTQQVVSEGDKFNVVYTLNKEGGDIRLPSMENFQILMGPSTSFSQSTSIINGKVTREINYSFTYVLKALKEGTHTIPPATITVGNEKVQSNALSINVLKGGANAPSSSSNQGSATSSEVAESEGLFITVIPSKRNVYQGESLLLTTKIYTNVPLESLSDIKHPEMAAFIKQELNGGQNIQWSQEIVNNKAYNVGIYEEMLVFPQKSGQLKVEPTEIEFMVRQRTARRSRSLFDDFFDSGYRLVKQRVKSKPFTINVKPLPGNQPANFSGGVGEMTMNASVSKSNVSVNDGITLKVEISGSGNLKFVDEPNVSFSSDFDAFDAKVTNNIKTTATGLKGSKIFEYLIIPRYAGEFTIPQIEFTYFDVKAGKFMTRQQGPFTINVEKGAGENSGASGTVVRSATNKESVKYVGKDIRHIKLIGTGLHPKGKFFFGSLMFYISILFPVFIFVLVYVLNRKRLLENENISLAKNKRANKLAQKRLKVAAHELKAAHKEAFYQEVSRALWGYMSDKLNLPLSELSKDNISEVLQQKDVEQEAINTFIEILDTCEFARYAPSSGSDEMEKLFSRAIGNISQLENNIKRGK